MLGGSFAAWFQDGHNPVAVELRGDGDTSTHIKKRSPVNADLFGSICYSFQHGKFRELYGDLTRIDARLDIGSASAFAKRVVNGFRSSSANSAIDPISSPRINLIFQQQVCLHIIALYIDRREFVYAIAVYCSFLFLETG